MEKLRIGIVGAGNIAQRWMGDACHVQEAQITCVAARDLTRVRAFADQWGIPHALDTCGALFNHPEVDAVYIATPHPQHHEHAIAAMRAGKHVLCEKPATLNETLLREMLDCAKECGVFFMEAMWTRFFPAVLHAKRLLADGEIGKLRMVHAQFAFRAPWNPQSRLLDLSKGGGALLDVGCYPLAFAMDMFGGAPDQVTGTAAISETGADEQNAMTLRFPGGGIAVLMSAVRTDVPVAAVLYGTEGSICIPGFYHPNHIVVTKGDRVTRFEDPYDNEGFAFEIRHLCECVRKGLTESPRMTHGDSLMLVRAMDALRAQWGLRYPMEG